MSESISSVSLITLIVLTLLCVWLTMQGFRHMYTSFYESMHHPYLRLTLTEKYVFDPTLFHCHNHCKINFKNGHLTAFRYENRILFHEKQNDTSQRMECGVTPTAIGHFHSAIHNYVVLQLNDDTTNKFILQLPQLPDMHPKIRANQSWEDPRLFVDATTQRLFLTGTVLTLTHVRIGMVEIDPVTFRVKNGFVLGSSEELGEAAAFSQKNWCLFNDCQGQSWILTHALPWTIYQIDLDTGKLTNRIQQDAQSFFSSEISNKLLVRCSSGMIQWSPTTLLTVLHVRDEDVEGQAPVYRSVFVEFENTAPFVLIRKSKVFQFLTEYHRVEFVAGLCYVNADQNSVCVSIGLDDVDYASIEINRDAIFS